MKISIRNLSTTGTLNGLVKTIARLPLNLLRIPSPDALPYKMLMYGIPYEASQTYRTIRYEFEKNKSLVMIETRQALCRC